MNKEEVVAGLEWILDGDRFGFGVNWDTGEPKDDYEKAGQIIWWALKFLKQCPLPLRCGKCSYFVIDDRYICEELDGFCTKTKSYVNGCKDYCSSGAWTPE